MSTRDTHATDTRAHATRTREERIAELEAARERVTALVRALAKTADAIHEELLQLRLTDHHGVLDDIESQLAEILNATKRPA